MDPKIAVKDSKSGPQGSSLPDNQIESKGAEKQSRIVKKERKTLMKTKPKPKGLYRLQKLRSKRCMNPFLCFAQEQRKHFKYVTSSGSLLSEWKAAHKGLGAKWRALGNGNTK